MTQSSSDKQQAQLLMHLIYEIVPTYDPFPNIDLVTVLQAFHNRGGQIPEVWPPGSLQHPEWFFHLVEHAAGAMEIERLADFARTSTLEAFENHLHELKEQFALPITSLCYLRAGMVAELRALLIKGYPAR